MEHEIRDNPFTDVFACVGWTAKEVIEEFPGMFHDENEAEQFLIKHHDDLQDIMLFAAKNHMKLILGEV